MRKHPTALPVILLFAFAAANLTGATEAPAESTKPMIIGHRGAAGLAPENTLAAFRRALDLGVDGIEMDVHLTAGGTAVVHHDARLKPDLARAPDGRWLKAPGPALRDLTLAVIETFDVGRPRPGSDIAKRYPDLEPADGERIPTLAQVFALARGNDTVRFWIEIKTSPVKPAATPPPAAVTEAVIGAVRRAGVAKRTVLLSFNWRALVHAQKIAPDIPTDYLSARFETFDTIESGRPGTSPWTAGFDVDEYGGSVARAVHAAGGRYWGPHHGQVTREALAEAHRLGLSVVPWTVNGPRTMRRLIGLGVDGITTDRPDVLLEILGRR